MSPEEDRRTFQRRLFIFFCLAMQGVFIVLFAVYTRYAPEGDAKEVFAGNLHAQFDNNQMRKYYPGFQDIQVMIFAGFGFLMCFLKRYGFSALGVNLLVGTFVLQWALLVHGWFTMHFDDKFDIEIGIIELMAADFAAAAVLISFGAVLGKTSPIQLLVMALIEVVVQQGNRFIGIKYLQAMDPGESMYVHIFGAYFGLTVSRVLYTKHFKKAKEMGEGSVYHSDMFVMIATIFLWLYWPSFNAGASDGDEALRSVINTYFSLVACIVVAFAVSALVDSHHKFDMVHIQNSTLAGGVAVGAAANLMIHPFGALIIGSVAGALSVIGYKFLTPLLERCWQLYDTCGVNNLHGMPGILGGIVASIAAAFATAEGYSHNLYTIYPARAPTTNTTAFLNAKQFFPSLAHGVGRSASTQAGFQFTALLMTALVAVLSGAITGYILRLPVFETVGTAPELMYSDEEFWKIPSDFVTRQRVQARDQQEMYAVPSSPPIAVVRLTS